MSTKVIDEDVYKTYNYSSKLKSIQNDPSLDEVCDKVRQQFQKLYEKSPELYDKCDMDRVMTNDFTVKRFVLWNELEFEKSVKQLDETMKWRKESGVNVKCEKDAPIEFYRSGAVFNVGVDRNGLPVIYFRAKTAIKIKKLQPILHLMAINILNKIDTECNGNGFVCVVDLYEVGLKNADLDLIQFVINLLRKYFPLALSSIIVLNMPWYLKGLFAVIKMWLSAEEQVLLKFASGPQELFKYIDESQVPAYLGGTNTMDFTVVPEGCQSCLDICESYGISKEEAKEYMKKYRHIIEEGQKLVRNRVYGSQTIDMAKDEDEINNNTNKENLHNNYSDISVSEVLN